MTYVGTGKYQLKEALLHELTRHTNERNQRFIDTMVVNHCVRTGSACMRFNHRGEVYGKKGWQPVRGRRYVVLSLHTDLRPEMDAYLGEKEEWELEQRPLINTYISHVLNTSDAGADYKKLLPNIFHNKIDSYSSIYRSEAQQLSDIDVEKFLEKNEKYLDTLRDRLMLNLLEAP